MCWCSENLFQYCPHMQEVFQLNDRYVGVRKNFEGCCQVPSWPSWIGDKEAPRDQKTWPSHCSSLCMYGCTDDSPEVSYCL